MSTIDDPFVSSAGDGALPHDSHRYSSFDNQLFNLDASSPAQAKRALEAHLAETERRLEEASKLGTALVEQQKELEDKLKEVEQQQEEGQIGPDLRRKLADLEKEYNEIGRETTRAFLAPKRLAGGDDAHLGTPSFDQKVSPPWASPTLYGTPVESRLISSPVPPQRRLLRRPSHEFPQQGERALAKTTESTLQSGPRHRICNRNLDVPAGPSSSVAGPARRA